MKKVFYYTDLMPFLSNSEKAISKIKRTFNIIKENHDIISFVWHPYSRTEEFLRLNECTCIDEYLQLIKYYKENNLGEYDEETDISKPSEYCDAYYGDYSDIVPFFTQKNKPVMIQNIDL